MRRLSQSVHPLARAGGHPSGTAIAGSLVRSTREHRAGRPQALAQARGRNRGTLLTLLPGEVYQDAQVTQALVVSYNHSHHPVTCKNRASHSTVPPIVRRPPCGIAPPLFLAELALNSRRRWNAAVQFAIRRRS